MIFLILDCLVLLSLMIMLIRGTITNYSSHKNLSYLIGILAFFCFVSTLMRVFWVSGLYDYSESDLLTLKSVMVMLQAVIFYFFVRIFKRNNLTNLIFFLYLVSLSLIFLSPLNFRVFSILLSFFFMLLIFLNLVEIPQMGVRRTGYIALLYCGVSLIAFLLSTFGIGGVETAAFISDAAMILLAFCLSTHLKDSVKGLKPREEDSVLLVFMKYFIFILAFTNLVLIATLGLHEFSHVMVARYYDCDARAIFFEKGIYPYSEIDCTNTSGKNLIALAGPIVPIILAIILFFVEGSITRAVALLAAGFNLVAASKDFKEVGMSDSMILVCTIFGVFLLILGVLFLAQFILRRDALGSKLTNEK